MKKSIAKYLVVFVLFAAVFNFAGCALLLYDLSEIQDVILEAEDGGKYDFYVDNALVCRYTDRCIYAHNKRTLCQHTIDIKRDDVVYGTLFYGYWEERPVLVKMMVERDDNKCPETWKGASVIVEIDPEVMKEQRALQRKANEKRWNTSPFSSSSAE